jgi:hypothetical protein
MILPKLACLYIRYYYFSAFSNEYVNAADDIARNAINIAMIASIKSSPLYVSWEFLVMLRIVLH